ncbi:MAG: DUF4430 domain-containing protein [Clostridia bacterium]|nr:DUF4430 domain-containing protein [Clostridia bacterium]
MKSKKGIWIGILAVLVLAIALFVGNRQPVPEPEIPKAEEEVVLPSATPSPTKEIPKSEPVKTVQKTAEPTEKPVEEKTEEVLTCTLSVRCDAALRNADKLKEGKLEVLPSNGVIFQEQAVAFAEGESVFDVLLGQMQKNKIHFEFVKTPMYDSAYIEGIGNLYEFDCGELSGWLYRVNGVRPTYGCSQYPVKKDDKIEFFYTCDFTAET